MPTTLARVMPMITSLLNAAGWKSYLLGSINAGGGLLTVGDAAFTADDVGKKVAIDGAGAAGSIYEGVITGFTDATHVTVNPVASISVVGTTVSYGGRLNDDRRNLFELREAAFESDEAHYLAIAETKGHWLRPEIMTFKDGILHEANLGTEIPHIGPLGRVFINAENITEGEGGGSFPYRPGIRAESEVIERLRANPPGGIYGAHLHDEFDSQIAGYFWMPQDENTIRFTGSKAKIYYVPSYVRGANLKSPEIFTASVVSLAVARLLAKEGAKTPQHAAVHGAYSEAVIAGIRANEQKISTIEEFQQETPPARAA